MTNVRLPGFMQRFDDEGNVLSTSFAYLFVEFANGADTTLTYDVVDTSGTLPEILFTSGDFTAMVWGADGIYGGFHDDSYSSVIDLENTDGEVTQIAVLEPVTSFGYI